MSTLTVFKGHNKSEIPFLPGKSLLDMLRSGGYPVNAPCGGDGRCGKCLVGLNENGVTKNVLACRTFPQEDCLVTLCEDDKRLSWNETYPRLSDLCERKGYGVAVDLGTTTVAAELFRLADGKTLGSACQWNAQRSCGGDVITRIDYCMKNTDGLSELSCIIRSQIAEMLTALCENNGILFEDISEIVVVGNTVMQHIFAGLSPESIAAAPFMPLTFFDDSTPYQLGGVHVFFSPCVAGYVGGDITSSLLHTGLFEHEGKSLFLDVGTNGEMVLGDTCGLTACAVASGPAFEGAELSCGMPAADGAVYSVELSDTGLSYCVIGGGEAKGLCGSGLLDLVACLLDLGYIDESGCLAENENGEAIFRLTDSVFLTQRDVRQLQLAKGAVATGVRLLLRDQKLTCDDLERVYLAGGFGNRLRAESAIRVGMLPREFAGKIVPVGNAALAGAERILLSFSSREGLRKIKENCHYIELSSTAWFDELFVEEMSFPENFK